MAGRRMDAISLLESDHRKVEKLFKEFQGASERATKTKMRLSEMICSELEMHTSIEEEIFYPPAHEVEPDMIAEAVEEHGVVKHLMEELRGLSTEDEQFEAKMAVLIESVGHHVEEEERELFPKLKKELGADRLNELGEQLAQRKSELAGVQQIAGSEKQAA